ncbi:hypothetical protein AB2S62_16510 [Vibrio sp. NTOU-M3]|uniref:hypothetical protein n=1 Tax=Vibrio sp. NTOU-M3 TaxID=3234954 RepID=UPI00349F12E4
MDGDIPFTASYDAENRLISIAFSKDGVAVEERFTYQFNHFLAKYERLENNQSVETKHFVRLGLVELQERDSQDNVLAENAWRLDMPGGVGGLIARVEGNQHYSYLTNHLGHVYGVLDNEGNRITTHAYTPYGEASGDSLSTQP